MCCAKGDVFWFDQLAGPPSAGASSGHVTTTSALPQTISTVTEYFPGPTHHPVSSVSVVLPSGVLLLDPIDRYSDSCFAYESWKLGHHL